MGMQLQELDHEMIGAAKMLDSDDPEEVAEGTRILEDILAVSESTKTALAVKADRCLIVAERLTQQAAARKTIVKRLAALVKADEAKAEKLSGYVIKVLTTLNPADKRFSLPTHEITSSKSTIVILDEEAELDPKGTLHAELVRETITYAPDKNAIKAALKKRKDLTAVLEAAKKAGDEAKVAACEEALAEIPETTGARLSENTNWTIK